MSQPDTHPAGAAAEHEALQFRSGILETDLAAVVWRRCARPLSSDVQALDRVQAEQVSAVGGAAVLAGLAADDLSPVRA